MSVCLSPSISYAPRRDTTYLHLDGEKREITYRKHIQHSRQAMYSYDCDPGQDARRVCVFLHVHNHCTVLYGRDGVCSVDRWRRECRCTKAVLSAMYTLCSVRSEVNIYEYYIQRCNGQEITYSGVLPPCDWLSRKGTDQVLPTV